MSRVRLPPGMLREVDGAELRAGLARRQAWPTGAAGGAEPDSIRYTPGARKGDVADDIRALLLPDEGDGRLGLGANDSLMEEMLQKAAGSAAPTAFNSVPWDTSGSNADAQDYLRSIMCDMNRQVAVIDQTDADIQLIIDDPDAYIARTAGASRAHAGLAQGLAGAAAGSQQAAGGPGMAIAAKEARTRKLAQGATVKTASSVGRYDVSGLPSDSTSRQQPRSPEVSPVGPPRPDSGVPDVVSPALQHAPGMGDSGAGAHVPVDVPLSDMIEKKGQQTQEMQALCERLQMLVETAKEISARPPAASSAQVPPPAPVACAAAAGALGTQLSRDGGVKVRAQNGGMYKPATTTPGKHLHDDGESGEAVGRRAEGGTGTRSSWRVQDLSEGTAGTRSAWRVDDFGTASVHADHDKQAEADVPEADEDEAGESYATKSPKPALKSPISALKSPMSAVKKTDTFVGTKSAITIGEDEVGPKAAAGGKEGSDRGGATQRTTSGVSGGGAANKAARARKQFVGAVSKVKAMKDVVDEIKGPTVVGRKVGSSIGRHNHQAQAGKEQGHQSSAEVLREMMAKLALSWKSVGAIFNHFDRPDMEEDGQHKGDSEISLEEFALGIRKMKLDFTEDQIVEVFHLVDKDGSGTIDHSELEAVLRECGVLKSIAVQRVPKTVKMFEYERAEKKIEEEAKEEQDKKRKGGKPKKGQPIDIPGMSNQVAEGLHALEERVETLRGVMQEVRGNSNQFNLILEQYSKAAGDAEEKTRMQLLEAGEGLVQRMADGISNYKNLANEIHEFSVELIRDLPRDYRVVWKAAVCSEIDEKGGLVRVFNEEMYECEKEYLQMKEQCREWRVVDVKNPTLDFTVTKDADGPVGVSEGYAQTMQQAREWVKSAVGFGFAQQKDMVRKLESVKEHVDEDEVLDGKSLMGVTQALGEKLAPYVEESTARIAARLEERNAFARNAESSPQNGKRGDGMPSGKSANRSSTQASVRSQGRGAAASGQMSGASASAANALSVSMFASHANAQRRNKMSLVGGTDVNYEGMYQQLSLVQEMRSQFESGLEAADLSSIADTADTSIDSEVRQLVKTRLTQVSRDVKEAVAHSHPSTLAHAHAQSPTMPVSSAAATKQPSEVLEDASPGSQRPRLRARERNQLAKAAAEEARGQWASGAPRRDLGKGSPGKSVWKKLDEQIARHAQTLASGRARTGPGAKVEVAAPHVSLPQGTVRRTTKPPPDRIVSSTAVPKGLNTVSRHDGQARAHRSAHVPSDTRISRARTHVIPTATCSLLTRPSKNTVEGSADIMDKHLASSLLPPENPAAKALSDLQKAALEKMIFCGVTFEVHLPEAGVWTAVAEANFVRELSALLGVPTSDVGLDGRVSDLVPTTLHLELRHSKHLAGDIVDQVSVQAQDPSSLLWALPHLAKIMAQGMIFEKSAMHGSPPREDVFLEASADASPQLTSHAWEEVKAPMMREQSPDKDNMVASEACVDPDLTKDRPALSPAGDAAARSRRSLDFHEISGSGISTPVIKHRKPELADRVRQSAPLPQDEESVTERVLNYLSHHILAHIESDSKFQTSSTWRDEDPLKDLDELRRERRLAGACSPFIAGLLGSEGLMLLTQAGIDVDDDSVLELAEANILEEARRAFRKKRQGDDVEALPANEEGLSELPQPGLGRRPVVLRESTQPFKTGNTAHQDEQAEELILSMLLALMETAEEEDPEVQAALDAETRLYLAAKEEEAQRQAAFAKARQLDDDTRQSVASLLSQDGDGAMVTAEEPAAGDGVQSSSEIETGSVVQEAVRELAHQPPPIAFDNERVERHHQLVEDTLVRIADSMDALTNLTMHLASAAERAPATLSYPPHQPAVGAVHVHSGQSPALHSAYSGGDFAVGESVVRSASTSPPSDDSPSSAIVESDYTPPKSADSDEAWTPVQGRTVNDQDVQTSIDFDVQAAMRELTSGFAHRPQLETHSAQTSIDFDAMYPNLRTRSRGRAEAVNQQLQTSFDLDDAASASRLVASSTNTSAPPSPAKALKAHPVEPAGVTSASQLTEPLTHTLISTLQSVAEEVALLRESRLVQQSPGAARSREVALGAAEGGEREHESAGRESAQASSAVPLQEWLRLDTSHVDAGKQVQDRAESPKASTQDDTDRLDTQPGQTGSSPDASTSMSEGEFRDPFSVLAIDTSFVAPGSPPASQGPLNLPSHTQQTVDGSQTQFPLTFSGMTGPHQPSWREGGPAYRETVAVLPRPGGRAERRAARQAARRLRNSARSAGVQSAASFMTTMDSYDVTADSRTESELSDGELAGSVVWWIGTPEEDHSMMKGSGGDSEASDGEVSRPASRHVRADASAVSQ